MNPPAKRLRNVLVVLDDGYAYRARLQTTRGTEGYVKARGGSEVPTGWYHLSQVIDVLTGEALG